MGWFLSSKSTKTAKTRGKKLTKKKTPWNARRWDPSRTLANMWLISWTLLLTVGAVAWYFGESYLMNYVSEKYAHQRVSVQLVNPPAWMDQRLAQRLERDVELMVEPDPFDHESLQRVAAALADEPWVQRVDRVLRRGAGDIEVHATYRRPAALIRGRDGYHLVDRTGVRLLSGRYSPSRAAETGLPVIEGVAHQPPPAGQAWPGQDVHAGLTLARLIRSRDWGHDVTAIDVRNYNGRLNRAEPHIVMPTRYGGVVRWGRAIGEEQFYEPHYEQKLKMISHLRRQRPSLWAASSVVDVFRDQLHVDAVRPPEGNSAAEVRYTLTSD